MRRNLKEDDGGRMEYLKALEDALETENYLCTWGDEPLGKLIVDTDLGMFDIDYVPGEWVYVVHFSGPNREFTKYRKYTDDVVEIVVNVVEDQLDDWSTEHYIESKKSNKKENTLDLFGQNAKVHKDKNWRPGLAKKQIKERRMPYSEIPQVEDYVGTARAKGFECIEGTLVSRTKEVFTPVIMKINGNVEARLRIFSQGNYTIFTDKGGWEGLDLEEFEKDLDDLRSLYESVSKKSNRVRESRNLKERVLDYDTWDKYYDEGSEAYFEGKTLSDVPITGNAWFREAWEEGWKNAKACDDEDARRAEAEYEEELEWEEAYREGLTESKISEDKNYVVVKILDSFDTEARNVIESYGGQLDYDIWSISKENIQDVKDEIDDWKNRIAFYSSYNYSSGRFGKKLIESKVILHFDLEGGEHKALPFESTQAAMEYMDSDDFPIGEWVGDYELEYVKETKPAEDDYEYKVLQPEDIEKLNDLVKEIKDGNEDGWCDWISLAIDIGRKYLGKSLSRYGEGEYTPFEELINDCETFVYYKTPGIDRMLKKRLDFQNEE